MRSSERGFTLLEVLAAVAVLGILYTVLSGVAARGLRSEGESRRRLEASLLADGLLAELEAGLNQGLVPPAGTSESQDSRYAIRMEVSAFVLPQLPDDPAAAEAPRPRGGEGLSLFPEPGGRVESPVRRLDLAVSWLEGFEEHRVTRTTFALDLADPVAAGALAVLAGVEATP